MQPTFVEPTAVSFGASKPHAQAGSASAADADVLIGHEAVSSSTSDAHYPVRHGLVRPFHLPPSHVPSLALPGYASYHAPCCITCALADKAVMLGVWNLPSRAGMEQMTAAALISLYCYPV